MTFQTSADRLQGKRIEIVRTDNPFAAGYVGKTGTVVGHASCGMVMVDLNDGTRDYYHAEPRNLRVLALPYCV